MTGLGAVSPVAIGAHKMFDALCEGKSGISRLPSWADEFPAQLGATVKNFDPKEHGLKGKTVSRNARYTHFAMIAAQQALLDGAIDLSSIDKERFGVIVGSGIGGIEWYEDSVRAFAKTEEAESSYRALRGVNPFLIPALISNTASGMIAIEHGAKGPNYAVATACATGSHAIGAALKHLRDGEADVMLAVRRRFSRCWLCLCNAGVPLSGRKRGGHHPRGLRGVLCAHGDGDEVQRRAGEGVAALRQEPRRLYHVRIAASTSSTPRSLVRCLQGRRRRRRDARDRGTRPEAQREDLLRTRRLRRQLRRASHHR